MKKLCMIAIIVILLSGMLYGSFDNLNINDSTQTIPIQGTTLISPTASTEKGNAYCFGLALSYDLVNIPYFRMYLSTGTSYHISSHNDRKWYIGVAPMIDFSIPPFEFLSFNIGYSASYVSEHWNPEHEYTFKYNPEIGFYYRIF